MIKSGMQQNERQNEVIFEEWKKELSQELPNFWTDFSK